MPRVTVRQNFPLRTNRNLVPWCTFLHVTAMNGAGDEAVSKSLDVGELHCDRMMSGWAVWLCLWQGGMMNRVLHEGACVSE